MTPTALFGDCTGRISTVGVNSKLFFIAQTRLCLSVEAIIKKQRKKRPKKCTENQPKKRGPIHPKISARTLPKSPPDAATINAGRCLRPTDFYKWPQHCPEEDGVRDVGKSLVEGCRWNTPRTSISRPQHGLTAFARSILCSFLGFATPKK
jgi:hypothetical protein